MVTLFTHSRIDLYDSLSEILGYSKRNIEDSILKLTTDSVYEIPLNSFFKSVGLDIRNKENLYKKITIDKVILSHLSSRMSEPKNQPLFNLHDVLTEESDLRELFLKYGISFVKKDAKIVTYQNGTEINWDNFSSYPVARIKKRLLFTDKFQDNCINGFLFNDRIWESYEANHLTNYPEILDDISYALQIKGIKDEWMSKAKLYCIGIEVRINDVIYDRNSNLSLKEKILFTYQHCLNYLLLSENEAWCSRMDNPMIRLKDKMNVCADSILGYYEVNLTEL